MTAEGLIEVANPSSFFLSQSNEARPGAVVTALCEGNRPLLIEVQALVTPANYGNAQRVAGGIDNKKLALLLAILEKRCGFPMAAHDVFVSIAGGLKISEPATDLAILVTIVSSLLNKPVAHDLLVLGEVGLGGEVRAVTMADRRVAEATKLGFSSIILPKANADQHTTNSAALIAVQDIQRALDIAIQ